MTAVAAGPGACGDEPGTDRVRVATLDELAAGPVEFELAGVGPCIVVQLEHAVDGGRGPDESIVAFSSLCPHMGCPFGVDVVDPSTGRVGPCGCHHSVFDLGRGGRMVQGRASSNLVRVELEIEDDVVFAIGAEGVPFGAPLTADDALTSAEEVEADGGGR